MRHEKIIRRPDGSRIKIEVYVYLDSYAMGKPSYSFETSKCEKGKRTFIYPHSDNDYTWRGLSIEERKKYSDKEYLTLATKEEIYNVLLELWEKLKPEEIV